MRSIQRFKKFTKPFEYPIPRYDDAISIFQVGTCRIWIITVDSCQGYHQVFARKKDREKLAFFSPDDKKYCFKVIPFGPVNAPSFYFCMMEKLKKEWDILLAEIMESYDESGKDLECNKVHIVNGDIYLCTIKL